MLPDVPDRPASPREIREWDRIAIEEYGIPGPILMENAGAEAARRILRLSAKVPETYREPWHILCGPGGNGGDGFVVARYLSNAGQKVTIYTAFEASALRPDSDAAIHHEIVRRMGLPLQSGTGADTASEALSGARGTIVDALLGTGLSRDLEPPCSTWVKAALQAGLPVIALDIPTGLDGESGEIYGACLRADQTLTFAAAKTGFSKARGPEMTGTVQILDIGLPRAIWEGR